MNCEKCLNRGDCEDCAQVPVAEIAKEPAQDMAKNNTHIKGDCIMVVVKFCPKCKKQAAEYRFNEAGNLAFHICACCGYTAAEYAKDLKEGK